MYRNKLKVNTKVCGMSNDFYDLFTCNGAHMGAYPRMPNIKGYCHTMVLRAFPVVYNLFYFVKK